VTAAGQPAHDAVLEAFGAAVRGPDGSLDRAALAAIVFGDADRLRTLEAIVHPAVRPRLLAEVEAAELAGARIVAIEAIKLVESGLADLCDETWLVTCDRATQTARLTARGVARVDAASRIDAQGDIRERLAAAATRALDTSGSPDAIERAVDEALEEALAEHAAMDR
jgi:dephospho-CoA kinase